MRTLIILLLSSALAFGQNEAILFTVGEEKVTAREFEYLFRKNHQNRPSEFSKAGVGNYLDLYIKFKLKVKEAYRQGLDTTKAFQKEFDGYKKDIRKSFEGTADDADRLAEEAHGRMGYEVRASHILFRCDPDAPPSDTLAVLKRIEGVKKRILAGEDFGTVARQVSEDPSAASNGGDLGYFSAFEMVYPFESAAYNTPVGTVSDPVRTRFGYHLVKVIDKRPSAGEIEIAHIMIRKNGEDPAAREKIFDLAEKLKAGSKWEDLCRENSDDFSNRDSGGKLPPFRKGTYAQSAPLFEEAAFSLKNPGEVTDPVQTTYGWHLIRLERKIPVASFAEMKPTLVRRVSKDERMMYTGIRRIEHLKKSFGYTENRQATDLLVALADSSMLQGTWSYRGDPQLYDQVLFTMAGKSFKTNDFVDFVTAVQAPGPGEPPALMRQLYNGYVAMQADQLSEEKLLRENEDYRMLLQEYREGILLSSIMEAEVWNKASADTAGQRKFFLEHRDQYKASDRVRAKILGTNDEQAFKAAWEKINNGDSLLASGVRKFRTVSDYRLYERGYSKVVDAVPWVLGVHSVTLDKMFYIVDIKSLVQPGLKSLDEARASVISDYQDKLEADWLEMLKTRFTVSLNKRVKNSVIKNLVSEGKNIAPKSPQTNLTLP